MKTDLKPTKLINDKIQLLGYRINNKKSNGKYKYALI